MHACMLSCFSCVPLCDPMDHSLPGSSEHVISQARKLEWVVLPSSSGFSRHRDGTHLCYIYCNDRQVLYHSHHLGSPNEEALWSKSKLETACNTRTRPTRHRLASQSGGRLAQVQLQ